MSLNGLSTAISRGLKCPQEKLALMAIGDYADQDGDVCISFDTISEWACCEVCDVVPILVSLQSRGAIRIHEDEDALQYVTGVSLVFVEVAANSVKYEDHNRRIPIPIKVRNLIYEKHGPDCHYCGIDTVSNNNRTLDHKHPVSSGGTNDADNLVVCCSRCNTSKGRKPYDEFIVWRQESE